ncbi:ATP-binding protein [Segatella copri]|uniref:ATP-binding protein n=2 Tax=Segatella copri TaxID=165179 RepID=A0AA92U2U3_9BACT|nr:ATP-binding protein [Segatella copri]
MLEMIFLPNFEQNSVRLFCSKRYFLYICSKINAKIMAQKIIGRKQESKELLDLYKENKPVFAVIYGRRRVGKTFLVRELFQDKMSFYHTGLSPYELSGQKIMEQQLASFYSSLVRYGSKSKKVPSSWLEAFDALINLLEEQDADKRQVIFIDELPWLDTPRSGFVTALEHFWNGWAAGKQNVMLIVCGSATSWISDKLLNNKGGLFDRTTDEIKLRPFTLGECEEYYQANNIVMSKFDQIQCYMATGGIPYYISMLQKGKSLAQNMDRLFFEPAAKLGLEFDRLYSSLFTNAEDCMTIVRLLAQKRQGYTRKEIVSLTKIPNGGGLSATLKSLEVSDFITSYVKYDYPKREVYFRLTDFYSKFYLSFIDGRKTTNPHFWQDNLLTPELTAWRGFTFESLCYYHLPQIKQALGISGVQTEVSPWKSRKEKDGAQIDMIIDRADRVINVCEMKFCEDDFSINAAYDKNLRHKLSTFAEETKCRSSLHLTLVTTYGLKFNEYAGRVQSVVTMDDLFK